MTRLEEIMLTTDFDTWTETDIRFAIIVLGETLNALNEATALPRMVP